MRNRKPLTWADIRAYCILAALGLGAGIVAVTVPLAVWTVLTGGVS